MIGQIILAIPGVIPITRNYYCSGVTDYFIGIRGYFDDGTGVIQPKQVIFLMMV